MGEATHEQVNLMLKLYELRREPKLREARDWFGANFQRENRGRRDAALSSGKQGKYLHADGAWVLGNGGGHREPRAD